MKKSIAFFDFDGTITRRDSLAVFMRFTHGETGFLLGLLPVLPAIMAFKAGLMDRQISKEKLLSSFYRGWDAEKFVMTADKFAREVIPGLIRPAAAERLAWHRSQGHETVIVSASPEQWIGPWSQDQGFDFLSTKLQVSNGRITGRIDGHNCHGEEKVRRIRAHFNLERYDDVYAYGDSSGDKPMLSLATHAYYKPFRGQDQEL